MSVEKIKAYFKQFGMEDKVMELPVSSATVAEAAHALGCEEARIAKTLAFNLSGRAVLIVMAGDARVDGRRYKEFFHKKASMLKGAEVEAMTGFPVGGVCPFAPKEGAEVYLDESLKRFEKIYPACGSRSSAIELTTAELEKYSAAKGWINVGKL